MNAEANTNGKRRGRRWLPRLLALAVSIVFALAVGEIAVRVLGVAPGLKPISVEAPNSVYQKSDNPVLAYEMKANYRNEDADSFTNYQSTNSHGQRDVERSVARPGNIRRAILLGDSVVEGFGLPDLDDTISRRMETKFPNGQWEVLNFGISGYCTKAEIELLRTKGLQFQPDVVMLVFVQNDFENYNQDNARVAQGSRPAFVNTLVVYSHLIRLACVKLDLFGLAGKPLSNNNVVEGLAEFARLAAEHNFQPAIAVWPQFLDEGIVDLHPMPEGDGELIVERLARMHGIPTLRLSGVFGKQVQDAAGAVNPRVRFTVDGDGMHATPEASDIVAAVLADAVGRIWRDSDEGRRPFVDRNTLDEAAIVAAKEASRNEPDNAQLYSNLANLRARAGQLEAAASFYEQALEVDSDNADVHTNYGKLLARMENSEGARTHLERAVELAPEHAYALTNWGVFLAKEGDFSGAISPLQKAVELQPTRADSQFHLARALRKSSGGSRQVLRAAMEHYQRAVDINPGFLAARYQLAILLQSEKRLNEAVEQLRVVANGDSGNSAAANNLAWILATSSDEGLRDGVNAVGYAENAVRVTKREDPEMLDTLAAAYASVGRFPDAVKAATEGLALMDDPSHPVAVGLRERRKLYEQDLPFRDEAIADE